MHCYFPLWKTQWRGGGGASGFNGFLAMAFQFISVGKHWLNLWVYWITNLVEEQIKLLLSYIAEWPAFFIYLMHPVALQVLQSTLWWPCKSRIAWLNPVLYACPQVRFWICSGGIQKGTLSLWIAENSTGLKDQRQLWHSASQPTSERGWKFITVPLYGLADWYDTHPVSVRDYS